MNHHFLSRHIPSLLVLGVLACLANTATAGELPKRKPGLWEIDTQMQGMPNMGGFNINEMMKNPKLQEMMKR